MKKVFRGTVSKGQLVMGSDYTDHLFTLEESDVDVTVCKHKTIRSLNQNAYYWKIVVGMVSQETGYSLDEAHEILKGKFLSEEIKLGDEVIRYAKSTTMLTTDIFETLMTEIREWASVTLNIMIPQPHEVIYE